MYPKAILFIAGVSLIGPWIGREVIVLIVDMASVLAALAYGYVGFIGVKKSASVFDKLSCAFTCAVALLFIALLLWPTSPARLGAGSIVFLAVWAVSGRVSAYNGQCGKRDSAYTSLPLLQCFSLQVCIFRFENMFRALLHPAALRQGNIFSSFLYSIIIL